MRRIEFGSRPRPFGVSVACIRFRDVRGPNRRLAIEHCKTLSGTCFHSKVSRDPRRLEAPTTPRCGRPPSRRGTLGCGLRGSYSVRTNYHPDGNRHGHITYSNFANSVLPSNAREGELNGLGWDLGPAGGVSCSSPGGQ